MTIKVFILDDQEIVREGVRVLVEADSDLEVAGEAATVAEALNRLRVMRPDVALLDVRLPDGDGIDVCREIRSRWPDVACIMLTSFDDDEALFSAIMAGASGYLLKQVRGAALSESVKQVASGRSLLDPRLTKQVLDRIRGGSTGDEKLGRLTKKERRILDLIAEGKTNRQIAEEVYLAERTVKNYVSNLIAKLGVGTRTGAAVYVTRLEQRRGQRE